MSIQNVENNVVSLGKGIERTIDAGATGLMMKIAQESQYTKPIQSCVRELASNAVDSQNEKEKYFKISRGEARAEDYFIQRDGALYADSNWDASYYNDDHLSSKNKVELEYVKGEGLGFCDKFIVRDHGVGIGGKRLKVLIDLGVSTKRNRTDAIGGFGIGSRSPLSTDTEYYNTVSVYNGLKVHVKTFSGKMDSLVGKFNANGEANVPIKLESGHTIYAEKTEERNYTEVTVPCLRKDYYEFKDAVTEQLMFFDNITFKTIDTNGYNEEHDISPKVLHESEDIIVTEWAPFRKPYIVITNGNSKICYGAIEFDQLAMENKYGAVGIKCNIRQVSEEDGVEKEISPGVDVVPSRESVRWNENTKKYILSKFEAAQQEAGKIVENEIDADDYISWLRAANNVYYGGNNTVLGKLSGIIDKSKLVTNYNLKSGLSIPFMDISGISSFFKVRKIQRSYYASGSVNRDDVVRMSEFKGDIYFSNSNTANSKLDDYLLSEKGDAFILINEKELDMVKVRANFKQVNSNLDMSFSDLSKSKEEIKESILKIAKDYDAIEVPDDYVSSFASTGEDAVQLTPAEVRKANETFPVGELVANENIPYGSSNPHHASVRKIEDYKKSEIQGWEHEYYFGGKEDFDKLRLGWNIHHSAKRFHQRYTDGRKHVEFYMVNKRVGKMMKQENHINNYFMSIDNNNHISPHTDIAILLTAEYLKTNGSETIFHNIFKDHRLSGVFPDQATKASKLAGIENARFSGDIYNDPLSNSTELMNMYREISEGENIKYGLDKDVKYTVEDTLWTEALMVLKDLEDWLSLDGDLYNSLHPGGYYGDHKTLHESMVRLDTISKEVKGYKAPPEQHLKKLVERMESFSKTNDNN